MPMKTDDRILEALLRIADALDTIAAQYEIDDEDDDGDDGEDDAEMEDDGHLQADDALQAPVQ